MGKEGETKRHILASLARKSKTLSYLSRELSLAPSTVSQHLHELLDKGMIRELDSSSARKWKYYTVNENPKVVMVNKRSKTFLPYIIIVIVAFAALIFYIDYGAHTLSAIQLAPNSTVPIGATIFTVSDAPPQYNVSAVYLTIKGITLRSQTTGRLYKVKTNATVELVGLNNLSKVITAIEAPNGEYNEIILNISNATAEVNGTIEKIFLPSGNLRIFDIVNISRNTTNWIDLDFNLAESLHMLENGTMVMFPVINMRYMHGYRLFVANRKFIKVVSKGTLVSSTEEGMSQNGTMLKNFSMPANISIRIMNRGIRVFPGNIMSIAIWNGKLLAIQNIQRHLNQSGFNFTINSSSIPLNCSIFNGGVYCRLPVGVQPNASIREHILSVLNNSTMKELNQTIVNMSVTSELYRLKSIDPNASADMLSCSSSLNCILVPTFICRNGLPSQSACINSAYVYAYMNSYEIYSSQSRDHTFCPMFIVNMPIKCVCMGNECIEQYQVRPIPMPT